MVQVAVRRRGCYGSLSLKLLAKIAGKAVAESELGVCKLLAQKVKAQSTLS
jgi:hypothetical protein